MTEHRRFADIAFEQFWTAYPRKTGKFAARRAWDTTRPTPQLVALIMDALAWQRRGWTDVRFIPHPTTWLRQGRWLDEPQADEASRPDLPDTRGHVPPCRTNSECIEKFAREIDERRRRTSET